MLRRLKNLGAEKEDLLEVYVKQIRCLLELAVPAWQSSLTLAEIPDIERVQKSACHEQGPKTSRNFPPSSYGGL